MDTSGKIKLTDRYYLSSDGKLNFILEEVYEKRESKGRNAELSGELGLQIVGYYGSLQSVVKGMLKNATIKNKAKELSDYVDIIKDLEQQITKNLEETLPNKPNMWKNKESIGGNKT